MLTLLIDPALLPFVIAAGVLLGLVAIEVLSSLVGVSAAMALDHALGLHPDTGGFDQARTGIGADPGMGWLNAGRLPVLVVLVALLGTFAAAGIALTGLGHVLGLAPPRLAVAVAALVLALPATRWVSRGLGRLMPRDETYVLGTDGLVGMVGLVVVGPVRDGMTARGRFEDRHGNVHFPGLVPAEPHLVIPQEAEVIAIADRDGVLVVMPVTNNKVKPTL